MTNRFVERSTPRLVLRPFSHEDVGLLHAILAGEDVLRYFPGGGAPTLEQVRRQLGSMLKHWDEHGYGLWAVTLRTTGELLGRCGLQYLPETDEVEVDFVLGRDHWGRGYATEAGQASLAYGFETLDVPMIVGIVHPENSASRRVLEKLGMQFAEETVYFGMDCFRYVARRPVHDPATSSHCSE